PKQAGVMRNFLAYNVWERMQIQFPLSEHGNKTRQIVALAAEARCSKSTVQRILKGETGLNLDHIEKVAEALDIMVYQLLLPNLDHHNPQVAKCAFVTEER